MNNEPVWIQATVDDLKDAIYDDMERKGRYHPSRQRLTLQPVGGAKSGKALEYGKTLEFYDITTHTTIQYKDLGLQVRSSGHSFAQESASSCCAGVLRASN